MFNINILDAPLIKLDASSMVCTIVYIESVEPSGLEPLSPVCKTDALPGELWPLFLRTR